MEPLNLKFRSSMNNQAKEIALAFHGVLEQVVQRIHKRLSIKKIHSASNFQHCKLEVEHIFTSSDP
jgi:hypothetical protein